MTKSRSKSEDKARDEVAKNRVDQTHGGEVVEAVSEEELELVNDPECKHEKLIRDPTETEFNAFVCANPKCGMIALYDKK